VHEVERTMPPGQFAMKRVEVDGRGPLPSSSL
jgi:hypothetical protein